MFSPSPIAIASSPSSMHAPNPHAQFQYIGIDLAIDQIKAVVLDDALDVVLVDAVNFDAHLPEYGTQNGILVSGSAGDVHVAPVEMWLKALDSLFDRLSTRMDFTRVCAIGGSAFHAPIFLGSHALPSLTPRQPLHTQLLPHLPFTQLPVPSDNSAQSHALELETALGGPDKMAYRVGVTASADLLAAQVMRMREADNDASANAFPGNAWNKTARIGTLCTLLDAVLCGQWRGMSECEAFLSGFWSTGKGQGGAGKGEVGGWEKTVCEIVGGDVQTMRELLGDVQRFDDLKGGTGSASRRISSWWVERYNFNRDTIVTPVLPHTFSTYLSLAPRSSDGVMHFGQTDTFILPSLLPVYKPSRLATLVPHPLRRPSQAGTQDTKPSKTGGRYWLGVLTSRNAEVPRALVRDMYTKSWSAFDRLVAIVPPGGSIGLDNKLFSFWTLTSEGYPHVRTKGIHRFETGSKVHEFRDLRANPRCLIESQLMSFRVRCARLVALGIFAPPTSGTMSGVGVGVGSTTIPLNGTKPVNKVLIRIAEELGLGFNPYESGVLPKRLFCVGSVSASGSLLNANTGVGSAGGNIAVCGSVANAMTDIFNAPVFVPWTVLEEAGGQASPPEGASRSNNGSPSPSSSSAQQNTPLDISAGGVPTPNTNIPSRPALGSAYLARFLTRGNSEKEFEDDTRHILLEASKAKAAAAAGRGRSPRPGPGGSGSSTPIVSGGGSGLGFGTIGSGNSNGGGTLSNSVGFGRGGRSGLSAFLLDDEEEEEDEQQQRLPAMTVDINASAANGMAAAFEQRRERDDDIVLFGENSGSRVAPPAITTSYIEPVSATTTPNPNANFDFVSPMSNSTAFTSPDPNHLSNPMPMSNLSNMNPNTTNFIPVTPLDDPQNEGGGYMAKVAEPDNDSFMQYAALVPEFCRLEAVVARGIL